MFFPFTQSVEHLIVKLKESEKSYREIAKAIELIFPEEKREKRNLIYSVWKGYDSGKIRLERCGKPPFRGEYIDIKMYLSGSSSDEDFQRRKVRALYVLVSEMFEKRGRPFKDLSSLIIVLLAGLDKESPIDIYSCGGNAKGSATDAIRSIGDPLGCYLSIVKKIKKGLEWKGLTSAQRGDYCALQRIFIKEYLKEFNRKLRRIN